MRDDDGDGGGGGGSCLHTSQLIKFCYSRQTDIFIPFSTLFSRSAKMQWTETETKRKTVEITSFDSFLCLYHENE